MTLYHVNPETGESGRCSASNGKCPFGGLDDHFTSEEAATAAGESMLQEQFTEIGLRKQVVVVSAQDVKNLIDELYAASEKYYQSGEESDFTDEEFDEKLAYLQSIYDQDKHPELFREGSRGFNLLESDPSLGTSSDENTILHEVPMLSLAKAKVERELYSFLDKARAAGAKGFRLQAKLDGMALAVEYSGGKIVRVSTRGDGVHGEDVTYIATDPNVHIQGLEKTISDTGKLEVRGELFFKTSQFEAADRGRVASGAQKFKNSRNAAVGLLKAAKSGVGYPVEFTFAAYSVIKGGVHTDMDTVHQLGFRSVDGLSDDATPGLDLSNHETNEAVMEAVHAFGKVRPGFDFPTDGVVIKPINEAEMLKNMGFTSHHPASQVAWKYPAETATTEVLGISITVGRSGKITPVAALKPVHLDGSVISNASLHNFNLVHTKGIRVGSVVVIEKANEIIPQVKVVISSPADSVEMEVPNKCPACGILLTFDQEEKVWPPKTMRCPNDDCDSRNFAALKSAVGKGMLDIDGMSEASLDYLNSVGKVKNIADLYDLTAQELADSQLGLSINGNPRRLGEKRANHIHSYIQKSKTRPLTKMLPALSIELLGNSASKDLERRFGDIDGILAATEEQMAVMDGWGPIKAKKIHAGLLRRRGLIDAMRGKGVTFGKGAVKAAPAADAVDLSGKSFAISGAVPPGFANRGQWVDYVEGAGGTFHSGPKAETSFMIGDPSETSAKTQKAVKLGIPFITPADFTSRFGKK